MNAAEEILSRVRAAAGGSPGLPAGNTRAYRSHGDHPPGDPHLIDLLAGRLREYKADVHRVTESGIADVAADILGLGSSRQEAMADGGGSAVVVPSGLPPAWRPSGASIAVDDGIPISRLEAMTAVMTAAAVAIAETGTIVLDGSADQGRRVITLLPDVHICVIRPRQVVATVPEALARLTPTRPLTWISGPSATSDIELDRVEGVHGPRKLHVVICASEVPVAGA